MRAQGAVQRVAGCGSFIVTLHHQLHAARAGTDHGHVAHGRVGRHHGLRQGRCDGGEQQRGEQVDLLFEAPLPGSERQCAAADDPPERRAAVAAGILSEAQAASVTALANDRAGKRALGVDETHVDFRARLAACGEEVVLL